MLMGFFLHRVPEIPRSIPRLNSSPFAKYRLHGIAPAVVILLLFSAGPVMAGVLFHGVHADLNKGVPESPLIGFVQPEVNIFQVSAGGVMEKVEKWCDSACDNTQTAIQEYFGGKLKMIQPDEFEPELKEELEDIQGLYGTIGVTIARTFVWSGVFPKKYRRFDYALGDMNDLFDRLDVDALLFVRGSDRIKTGGRKAFEVVALLAAGYVDSRASYMEMGLVGRSGKLLWYKIVSSVPKADFREPEGAKAYTDTVLEDFPLK
jgi:hypothetical protein